MKRILPLILVLLVCLLAIGFSSNHPPVSGAFAQEKLLSPDFQRPIHGWTVCADLGSGLIPGVGSRQRFQVCEASGWELLTYCLETEKPAPAVGVMCSFVNSTDLWCGELVQLVRVYTVLQTPAPTPTRTQTPTSTRTSTPTRTPLNPHINHNRNSHTNTQFDFSFQANAASVDSRHPEYEPGSRPGNKAHTRRSGKSGSGHLARWPGGYRPVGCWKYHLADLPSSKGNASAR